MVLALASVLLIEGQMEGSYTDSLRQLMRTTDTPLHRLSHAISNRVGNVMDYLRAQDGYRDTINQIRAELLQAQQHASLATGLHLENQRLRQLLEMPPYPQTQKSLVAQVYGSPVEAGYKSVTIDKGLNDGVFIGQVVADFHGIIGQVTIAHASASDVLLITDSSHAIPVKIARTGYATIAQGHGGQHMLKVHYITRNTDIRVGDRLLSSGIGGQFPSGSPVALVTKIHRESEDGFLEVYATPIFKFNQLALVLLLWIS